MRFKGYNFTFRLWPTVMTIPILIILVVLGNWQLRRLDWKLGIIHRLETRYRMAPVALPVKLKKPDDWEYRHVSVSGRYLYLREMSLYSIGPNGNPGYDLFTPLLTTDGTTVIVDRGWVPERLKERLTRPDTIRTGPVRITGVLRKSRDRLRFVPENSPDRNIWYYGNIPAMAKAQNLTKIFPMFIYADKGLAQGKYPVGGRTRVKIVNNHFDYALTWYGLAIVLAVIYLIFTTGKDNPVDKPSQ